MFTPDPIDRISLEMILIHTDDLQLQPCAAAAPRRGSTGEQTHFAIARDIALYFAFTGPLLLLTVWFIWWAARKTYRPFQTP